MTDNATLVGREGEPYVMAVERGKIREFARGTMSQHPGFLDDPVPVAPPTFLMTAAFWEAPGANVIREVMGGQLGRVLHAEQEFVFHGPPPRAGTELDVSSRVSDAYEKEGKRGGTLSFVVGTTEFRSAGRLVAEMKQTIVITSKPPSEG
jgi:hypothetical protein